MRLLSLLSLTALVITTAGCAADPSDEDMEDDADQEPASTADALTLRGYVEPSYGAAEKASILSRYANLDPQKVVPRDLLEDAVLFFHANKAKVRNQNYVSVIDFSRHSSKKRLFIVDLRSGSVRASVVAHGSGSDPGNTGTPTKFSNTNGSNASSLGYYITAETYSGKHGRSLRLDGVSSTNSNARARAVVMHGASYVNEGASRQGRSWGCPAIPNGVKDSIISQVMSGSVLFIGRSTGGGSTSWGSGNATPDDDTDPTPSGTSSSGGAPTGTAGGQRCANSGECNPGAHGSGLMCQAGVCVPGCTASWMCPGNQTCDTAAKTCR
ncbi:MAG: murein L,D-transpeptidase catalytic domain family protein [Deltaproteobacteria bacterium]|nr:murein L,D-transpeptidase catalytic domain family protein [Deltaproteobacteria bacterium]